MFSQRVLLPMSLWLPKNTASCFQPHNMSFCALGNRPPQARETLLASCPVGMVQTASLCPATREGRRQEPHCPPPPGPAAPPAPADVATSSIRLGTGALLCPSQRREPRSGPASLNRQGVPPPRQHLWLPERPLCPQGLGPCPGHSATLWVASETWVGRQERFSWARWWPGDSEGHLLLMTRVAGGKKTGCSLRQARPSFQAWASEESKDVTK